MNASVIAQLVIALGPAALGLIEDLIAVWTKPTLGPEEVAAICGRARKTYDEYIAEARERLRPN